MTLILLRMYVNTRTVHGLYEITGLRISINKFLNIYSLYIIMHIYYIHVYHYIKRVDNNYLHIHELIDRLQRPVINVYY